ncbi:uncharacterized protein LOC141721062 isoform X1 [Apium graveolens]|uniref:uncharacterized protein LOC141721062 isoform X1 n=1 Tax=Apium graveolens TaxID=4045 RepID=UPI003D7907BC
MSYGNGTNNSVTNQRYRQPGDSRQVYGSALYAPISYERNDLPLIPHSHSFGARPNAIGAINHWVANQDRARTEPSSTIRRPAGTATLHSPVRIIVLSNVRGTDVYPGLIPEFSPWVTDPSPAPQSQDHILFPAQARPTQDESRLTPEEQEESLKKLKREIYNPTAKKMMQRISLYYREKNVRNSSNEKEKESDEDGKNCAICLEDFEPRQIVMLTPCNHMFHEECIVPWVKSHGQCPVCRFSICDRIKNRTPVALNTNHVNVSNPSSGETDIMSIIRAMGEAYF